MRSFNTTHRRRLRQLMQPSRYNPRTLTIAGLFIVLLVSTILYVMSSTPPNQAATTGAGKTPHDQSTTTLNQKTITSNPLQGQRWYVDDNRPVVKQVAEYRAQGKKSEADLLDRIAKQPGAIWLTGPNASDPTAQFDINQVKRTSKAAAAQNTVPLYQLYAMPQRDACAGYSKGGFKTEADYDAWIKRILDNLQSPAVFAVEADAIGHTIRSSCLNSAQTNSRYALLDRTVTSLQQHPKVLAVYLDAAHSEWFADPSVLVEPLRKAGVDKIRGVTVNVSNFIATPEITIWAQRLAKALGNKGVLIDTSRNGQGSVAGNIKGDARWCNPAGRGIGSAPSTATGSPSIDGYAYIKVVGESDGDCFGNPPAGTFIPAKALEMARNARQ